MRVVSEHERFRGEVPVLRWMYRITTNLCLNRLRQRRAHPVVADPELVSALVELRTADGVDRRTVLQLLDRHDEVTQQIVVYYYLDDMSMEEVAETVGLSRKTVGKKLEQFREKARVMLEAPARGVVG